MEIDDLFGENPLSIACEPSTENRKRDEAHHDQDKGDPTAATGSFQTKCRRFHDRWVAVLDSAPKFLLGGKVEFGIGFSQRPGGGFDEAFLVGHGHGLAAR